jgi:hypothetical protein
MVELFRFCATPSGGDPNTRGIILEGEITNKNATMRRSMNLSACSAAGLG